MQENKPILVVGLGNPGDEYKNTRHNIGFMALAQFVDKDAVWKSEHDAKVTRQNLDGYKVIFAEPQTFMNDSGRAVQALMTFYKIPLENLVVIHDDMDLKVGTVREKVGGGSAGHNGIKSIDALVGNSYRRIRIGIGHPRDFDSPMDPVDWVLGKIPEDQMTKIKAAISEIKIL